MKITREQFDTIDNLRSDFYSKLSDANKEKYLNLYSLYSSLLMQYLIKNCNLKEYDDIILNSEDSFKEIEKEHYDIYQYISSEYLKFFYIRSNLHIERLDYEELNYLYNKYENNNLDLDDSASEFINNTVNRVIPEIIGETVEVNYGPNNIQFFRPCDALILGVRYDKYHRLKDESDDDLEKRSLSQTRFIDDLSAFVQSRINKNFALPVYIIQYNDYSITECNTCEKEGGKIK